MSVQGQEDPGNVESRLQQGAHLAGSTRGGEGGALGRDSQGERLGRQPSATRMRGSWVEGRCARMPLRMRAPGTQSFTCQAPPTRFSHRQQRLPALPPLSVASGPLSRTAALHPRGRGFITTLPALGPKNNLKSLKSPRPPAARQWPHGTGCPRLE